MDHEEINDIRIQRYLDGDLEEQERLDFEEQLKANPDLQSQADQYNILSRGIRYHARMNAWQQIEKLEEEAISENKDVKKASNRKVWPYWAIAASVALLVCSVVYLFFNPFNKNHLFSENFTPYPVLAGGPTRGENDLPALHKNAFAAYSNGNYAEAILLFEKAGTQEEDYLTLFYLGNAYLATGHHQDAILAFEKILAYPNALAPQARWYLGLSYLADGDEEKARLAFKELAAGSSSYSEKAKDIMNDL